jgi:hypothetical protein
LFGTTISRPEAVTVLCYAGRTAPAHVHFAPYYCAQVWSFRKIRALALERYLLAVRALLRPHAPAEGPAFLPGEQSRIIKTPILGSPDVADMIVACLAAWHAGQPHEDALPRGPHWRGFASAPGLMIFAGSRCQTAESKTQDTRRRCSKRCFCKHNKVFIERTN